jgi:hypothetical protein
MKKHILSILCVFALIIGSAGVHGWYQQGEKTLKKDDAGPILQDGVFTAEIGMEKNKEPVYFLDGNYHKKDKIIICDGTVSGEESSGEFTGMFKMDKKNYFEIKITTEEKAICLEGTYKFEKNKDDFMGEWCIGGFDKCFEFVYPISYVMPDGSVITGNSEKEIWQLIKEWYEANPDEKDKPVLQYPVDIQYKDGTIVTINDDEEMKAAYGNCGDYKDWGWITGTFEGMKDDSMANKFPNILERFPLLTHLLKRPVFKNILLKLSINN